jgi:hypothetical protein
MVTWRCSECGDLGGTDICSLFAGLCSALPVFRGEIQCRMLGMAIATFAPDGKPSGKGESGELVCLKVGQGTLIIPCPFIHVGRRFHDPSLSHVSPWGSGLCLATPTMNLFRLQKRGIMKHTSLSIRAFGVSALSRSISLFPLQGD